jgi:hypothetical protein
MWEGRSFPNIMRATYSKQWYHVEFRPIMVKEKLRTVQKYFRTSLVCSENKWTVMWNVFCNELRGKKADCEPK